MKCSRCGKNYELDTKRRHDPDYYEGCPHCKDKIDEEVESGNIQNEYIPHCPTCGSPNIHKISATNKVGSAVVFGVFSIGHVGKTYKCDNCGVEW